MVALVELGLLQYNLAKAIKCKVITTVGDKKKAEFCNSLGADLTIIYKKEDFLKKY